MLLKKLLISLVSILGVLLLTLFGFLTYVSQNTQVALNYFQQQTGIFVSYDDLRLELDGAQLNIQAKGLKMQSTGQWWFSADELNTDWSWMNVLVPGTPLGENLTLKSPKIRIYAQAFTESQEGSGFQLAYRPWKNIRLEGGQISYMLSADQGWEVYVQDSQWFSHFDLRGMGKLRIHPLNQSHAALDVNFSLATRFSAWGVPNHIELSLQSQEGLDTRWLPLWADVQWPESLPAGRIRAEGHVFWQAPAWKQVQLNLGLWDSPGQVSSPLLPLEASLTLDNLNPEWDSLEDWRMKFASIKAHHQPLPLEELMIEKRATFAQLTLAKANLQLLSILSPLLGQDAQNMSLPQGQITDFTAQVKSHKGDLQWKQWQMEGDLNGLQWQDAKLGIKLSSPAQHLSLTPKEVKWQLHKPLKLTYDTQQKRPLSLLPQRLQVGFDHQAWWLKPGKIKLEGMDFTLTELKGSAQNIQLQGALKIANLQNVMDVIPYGLLGEDTKTWMQGAINKGKNLEAQVQLQLPLDEPSQLKFQLAGKGEDIHLTPAPDFPPLNAPLVNWQYDKGFLRFEIPQVATQQLKATNLKVRLGDVTTPGVQLLVDGDVLGDLSHVRQYFLTSSLAEIIGIRGLMEDSQFAGGMQGKLHLNFANLADANAPIQVNGYADMDKASWQFAGLDFAAIQGRLVFNEKGIVVNNLEAQTLDSQVNVSFALQTGDKQLKIKAIGVTNPPAQASFLEGNIPWSGEILLPLKDDANIRFQLTSDLQPLRINLPQPLGKAQGSKQDLLLNGEIDFPDLYLEGKLTDMRFAAGIDLSRLTLGALTLGVGGQTPLPLQTNRLDIQGHLPLLPLNEWQAWWNQYQSQLASNATANPEVQAEAKDQAPASIAVGEIHLLVDGLTFKGLSLDSPTTWDFTQSPSGWMLQVSGEDLQGEALFDNGKNSLNAQFNVVNIGEDLAYLPPTEVSCEQQQTFLPNLSITTNDANIMGIHLGAMKLTGQQSEKLNENYRFDADFRQGSAYGYLRMLELKEGQGTQIFGQLAAEKIEDLIVMLSGKAYAKGGEGKLIVDLNVPGNFSCISSRWLAGTIELKAVKGEIPEADPGLGRLIGLLNITQILRRLTLDLADLGAKGFAYDEIRGKLNFKEGKIYFYPFLIGATSALIEVSGYSDLLHQQHDLKARVVPALGKALPTLAYLAGLANPVTALGMFVVQSNVKGMDGDLLRYTFSIKGDWNQPTITQEK